MNLPPSRHCAIELLLCFALSVLLATPLRAAPPPTGPETEKRFPPLKVPPGFKATLFACDPLIEYPSAVALGPRPDTVFLAVDYMTGLGTEIVRRSEIRLVEDTDGDGYADNAAVYADGFNSIEGLTFHAGTVYAMHAPFLTALRDKDGDGKADERRDLISGLGLPPEQNPVRLHCANGLVMGHDGWLYLALGDHGCDVKRPEGDRLVFEGGGILRCRSDGRDLHVFSRGLRNIYDVALDDELNVFVRDNENDGGDYKLRVCRSFWGADHGYPYLYYERPDEALPPLADVGLGSSAGGLCYLEPQFPAEYRGNLFFCEWGRSVVHCRPQKAAGGFAPLQELEFAAGAETDPYGFKPTDVVVERDGSLIVVDWADGQRPKRGRGRIYRIQYVGEEADVRPPASKQRADRLQPGRQMANLSLEQAISQLDSESYYLRVEAQATIAARGPDGIQALLQAIAQRRVGVTGRLHGVWILARDAGNVAQEKLFDWAMTDPETRVQAQAVRAIADLADPVLVQHRLDAGPGDAATAARLAALAEGKSPDALLEVIVATGRLRGAEAPAWLHKVLGRSSNTKDKKSWSPAVAHAAMQTLRLSGNWPAVLKLLDLPDTEPIRGIALRAVADQAAPELVDGLIARLGDGSPERRRDYADVLTRVYQKPAPWVYWGYRPPPRPANSVEWERTALIEQALDRVLGDPDRTVRLAVLHRMQREKVPARLATLEQWLQSEDGPEGVAAILVSLKDHPAEKTRDILLTIATGPKHTPVNRLAALALFVEKLDDPSAGKLLELAAALEDGPVLAAALRQLSRRPQLDSVPLLTRKLRSSQPEVRIAAIEMLADLRVKAAGEPVQKLLDDKDPGVRRAAVAAMGRLAVRAAIEPLLRTAAEADAEVRHNSLDALRLLGEPRAVPLAIAALADRQTQLAALECIGELGGPEQTQPVIDLAKRDPSPEVMTHAVRLLAKWSSAGELPAPRQQELERALAELQGQSGMLLRWRVRGSMAENAAAPIREEATAGTPAADSSPPHLPDWRSLFATGLDAHVTLADKAATAPPAGGAVQGDRIWLALTDVIVAEPAPVPVQFLASVAGKMQVWLNGRRIHERAEAGPYQPDSDRFDGTLDSGLNRLVVQVAASKDNTEFHVRYRRKSSTAGHEQLIQAALTRTGNAERGGKVFFDTAKAQCSKCHRIGDLGERIGPELTGIGKRFSRIHIVESILEPSRTVTPGFQTLTLALQDGRVLTGLKVSETETSIVLGDNQGQKHTLAKAAIEEQKLQPQSTMPDGLTKLLTVDQFVDLIAFLVSQK